MDKTFEPAAVEKRVGEAWEKAEAFKAGRKSRKDAPGFCIVIPPPNVTGSLHVGHALNNTLQDVLCRYWRMKGRDVLWQPGTDHAGIATQMMVEKKLASENRPDRRSMGREAFLSEVWKWKDESGGTIINQLKRMGASCDWSRERFTMDPGLSEAVLKVFVDLHKEGLIYKDTRLVNWDPKLLTAISDLEVEQREVKGHMWYFNYPLEGVDYNPEDDCTFITIATTRPETMLGDGAVAVHPENEKLGWMIGKRVLLPLVNRIIPIIADTYADPEKGTGAVKITAAHDFNDYEVGKRHNVPLINLFTAEAKLNENTPVQYQGMDRFDARKKVIADLEALGLLNKIEPHTNMVPHGDRSGVVIEPWLTEQWYMNVKPLAEKAMAAVRAGETRFVPKEREKIFFNWLENIEPWCISRQLWWGHQIPAWYGPDGKHFVAMNETTAQTDANKHYGKVVVLTRDPDVLDTWFSSALWPYSTLGWPQKTPELSKFYPNDVLVTGPDIIFFWVARMMMTGIHFLDEVPFRDVILHGIVRDEKGKKMSKTTGNVIDPLTVIDQYGADALRFTLTAMTMQGRDIRLAMPRVEGYRNFATKIWNAARFAEMNGCARAEGFDPRTVQSPLNRWVLSEAAKAEADIAGAIEGYRFNEAADSAYRFVWGVFCDWFIELSKPALMVTKTIADFENAWSKSKLADQLGNSFAAAVYSMQISQMNDPAFWEKNADELEKHGHDENLIRGIRQTASIGRLRGGIEVLRQEGLETQATVAYLIDVICQLLHPFMPYLTEELWEAKAGVGAKRPPQMDDETLLCLADWPNLQGLANAEAEAEVGWVVDLISEVRSVRSEMNVPGGAQVPLVFVGASPVVQARVARWLETLKRLARLDTITFADVAPAQSVQVAVRRDAAVMPLGDIIDVAAEKIRLAKEVGKLDGEIMGIDKKLGNAEFVAKAPDEVVEENRERLVNHKARRGRLAEAINRLG